MNATGNITTIESSPGLKVSGIFLFGYLLYWTLVFIMLKCLDFDLVFGLAKVLRKRQSSATCVNVSVVTALSSTILVPAMIAVAWTGFLNSG